MNTISKTTASFLIVALVLTLPNTAAAKGRRMHGQNNPSTQTSMTLTSTEQGTLLWMREEEKLARDVYTTFYQQWRQRIFGNISAAEQKHMNAMLNKLNQFGLDDPVLPEPGQFRNPTLQALYENLVSAGQQSYANALTVGATIEDMDIRDLMNAINETENLALQNTYQNLLEASKRHMRAFVGGLRQQGMDYTPQYISLELFDAIMGV